LEKKKKFAIFVVRKIVRRQSKKPSGAKPKLLITQQ